MKTMLQSTKGIEFKLSFLLVLLLFGIASTGYSSNSILKNVIKLEIIRPHQSISFPDTTSKGKNKHKVVDNSVPEINDTSLVFTLVETMPQFPGGDDARIKFLQKNIKYPKKAQKLGIQGKVFITFIVRADGKITDVKVLRGIGGGCDEEAIRVIKMMPDWIPGQQKGINVNVQFNLPLNFKLPPAENEKSKKSR